MRKNGKKLLSLALVLVMVLGMLPGAALAAALDANPLTLVVDSGTVAANIQWTVSKDGADYVLTLSGSGELRTSAYIRNWDKYNESIKKIVINEGITVLGDYMFRYCAAESIYIPASLTTFGSHALAGLDKLKEITVDPGNSAYCSDDGVMFTKDRITLFAYPENRGGSYAIPDGTVRIGWYAFSFCRGLTSVTIPDSVTIIEESAFSGCCDLIRVVIGSGVSSIGKYCFYNCDSLSTVTIPGSVTEIEEYAFHGCYDLTSVTIPNSVTSIGSWAFSSCTGLTSVTIPNSVTSIGEWAFKDCYSLTSIVIPNSVTGIGAGAFDYSGLKDVYYAGTEEQWKAIEISSANDPLLNATMHYGAAPGDVPQPERVTEFPFYPSAASNEGKVHIDWSLSLFNGDSTVQNSELAKAGLVLSAAAEHSAGSAEQILRDMGYKHLQSKNYAEGENRLLQPGAIFAHVQKGGIHYFAIVGRGTSSSVDFWTDLASLVEGFQVTAATVEAQFKQFARDECGVDLNANRNNCKFFVTGHSLGGAVANIITRNLNEDQIGFGTKNIFGYTYASPKTALLPSILSNQNIHNFLNVSGAGRNDIVPQVPPNRIFRYGRDVPLEDTKPEEFDAQYKQLTGMSYQDLAGDLLNPHYVQTYMALLLADMAINPDVINTLKIYLRIACPVDVEVRGADGQTVASVVSGTVTNNAPEDISVCVEDDVKYICFQTDAQYTIHLTGTDSGTMDYTIQSLDVGACEVAAEKEFTGVALTEGKKMVSTVNVDDAAGTGTGVSDVKLYVADSTGAPEKEVLPDGKGTEIPYEPKPAVVFTDIPADSYYRDAVYWAVERSIVNGTTPTTFTPDRTCTAAEIITLLWRAAGEPAGSAQLPFDVHEGLEYATGALRWAYGKKMIDAGFDQTAPCTRASAVKYIWQAAGSPSGSASTGFTDVPENADYARAVSWAVSRGIVNGTTPTTFSPDETCTRAQIVTLLYRDRT